MSRYALFVVVLAASGLQACGGGPSVAPPPEAALPPSAPVAAAAPEIEAIPDVPAAPPPPAGAPSQGPEVALNAVAVEREGALFRVTLQARSAAPEGTVYTVRVLPRVRRLAADNRSLVPSCTEIDAVACQGRVKEGAFPVSFTTSRLYAHEARFVRVPQVAGAPPIVLTFSLFDPNAAEQRMRRELDILAKHLQRFRELIVALEPHGKAGKPPPGKLLGPVLDATRKVRLWAETTDFAAAGSVLSALATQLADTFPWPPEGDAQVDPGAAPQYSVPRKAGKPISADSFRAELGRAEEVAVREAYLMILDGLEGRLRGEWTSKSGRDALDPLPKLLEIVQTGELAETCRAGAYSEPLASMLPSARKAVQDRPDNGLQPLLDHVNALRETLSSPPGR